MDEILGVFEILRFVNAMLIKYWSSGVDADTYCRVKEIMLCFTHKSPFCLGFRHEALNRKTRRCWD